MAKDDPFDQMISQRVGPFLREAGFRRRAGTWTKSNEYGDTAIINFQRRKPDFFVNTDFVPGAWWQYLQDDGAKKSEVPRFGCGIRRDRLRHDTSGHPLTAVLWTVTDAVSARRTGEELCSHLDMDGLPPIVSLLDRDQLLDHLRTRTGAGQEPRPNPLLAIVLSDHGPSAELDSVLANLVANAKPEDVEIRQGQADWVRNRLAGAGHTADPA